MESSQVVGAEEWSGSGESGWTMYLASSIHGERDGVYSSSHNTTNGCKVIVEHKEDGEESDDSMASDASTGHPERSRSTTRLRHAEKEENFKKHNTKKNKKKKNDITVTKGERVEEEILQHKADSAGSHI